MNTYIALLRGVNVSGKNKIKMVELKQLFINLGFCNVVTYIQSGNVIFSSEETNNSKIEKQLITAIKTNFGHSIKILVLKKNELAMAFKSNPFLNKSYIDFKKMCATFLDNIPNKEGKAKVFALANSEEEVIFKENIIYLYCPKGFGSSKLSNNNIEAKLKVSATSRNWNTVTKLVELSNQ